MAATLFAEQKGMAIEMKAVQFELIVTHAHEREREKHFEENLGGWGGIGDL